MVGRFKNRIKRTAEFPGNWYDAKLYIPNDPRDVLAYIWKAAWHDENKRMELMLNMQVIHHEKKAWWLDGRVMEPAHVLQWCEIPDGWQGVSSVSGDISNWKKKQIP